MKVSEDSKGHGKHKSQVVVEHAGTQLQKLICTEKKKICLSVNRNIDDKLSIAALI